MEAVREEEMELRGIWFVKQVGFKPGWKRGSYIDEQSCETEEEEVIGEGIGESEVEELVLEWGRRRDNLIEDNTLDDHCVAWLFWYRVKS